MAKKPYISEEIISKMAQKIKNLRVESGYTSYENFANDHNLDRKQYWRMEKGANITMNSLVKILNIHNVSFEDFFCDL